MQVQALPKCNTRESGAAECAAQRDSNRYNKQMVKDSAPFGEVRRALVIKLRDHGGVLFSSSVFSVLKTDAPHVEIDALDALLSQNPECRQEELARQKV